jgi:release factor glutamine methyltransferase
MADLMKNIPPQYLLGYEYFFEHRFKVTKDTLIPRPETEELVALCLSMNDQQGKKVVDIGTGTGAIAVSLKLNRPKWQVTAVDISKEALTVAEENAESLQTEIVFKQSDVLSAITEKQDIIISNPPYISEEEWDLMDESVRTYEPKTALFAENKGLAIYQKIALEGRSLLTPEGMIFLEIGFQQGHAVQDIFQQAFPDKSVTIHQDMSKNDRMIVVR